jgi:hypothetical protein
LPKHTFMFWTSASFPRIVTSVPISPPYSIRNFWGNSYKKSIKWFKVYHGICNSIWED